jgi:hypothetical protein
MTLGRNKTELSARKKRTDANFKTHMFKHELLIRIGTIGLILGAALRLSANWLAWPSVWKYNGPREATSWAIREGAYIDLSYFITATSIAILTVGLIRWINPK